MNSIIKKEKEQKLIKVITKISKISSLINTVIFRNKNKNCIYISNYKRS